MKISYEKDRRERAARSGLVDGGKQKKTKPNSGLVDGGKQKKAKPKKIFYSSRCRKDKEAFAAAKSVLKHAQRAATRGGVGTLQGVPAATFFDVNERF